MEVYRAWKHRLIHISHCVPSGIFAVGICVLYDPERNFAVEWAASEPCLLSRLYRVLITGRVLPSAQQLQQQCCRPAVYTRWTVIYKRPTAANVSCWPCHQCTISLMDCWKVSAALILQAVNDYDKPTKQQLSHSRPPPPSSAVHVKCEMRTKTENRIWVE